MGHHTAIIKVNAATLPANPSAETILRAAVEDWRNNEASRWASANANYADVLPMQSLEVAQAQIRTAEVNDEVSLIIPVTDDYRENTYSLRINVMSNDLKSLRYGSTHQLERNGKFPKNTAHVEIESLPKPLAPRAIATKGKAVTTYRIVTGEGRTPHGLDASYSTQAEARNAAIEYMSKNNANFDLHIESIARRESGTTRLVTIKSAERKKAHATFKLTAHTPQANAAITSYLVAFDYHE